MTAFRAGYYAFREGDMNPSLNSSWDRYESRLSRYALYEAYYNNSVYDDLRYKLKNVRNNRQLYRFTRGLRNPVTRLVDLCTAKCYGGSIDYQTLATGAIPIMQADDTLKDAIRQLFIWSNMGVEKSTFVRMAALLGDAVINIVDEPDKKKVRLEFLHPSMVRDVEFDAVGNVKSIIFEYDVEEEVTPDNFRTFTKKITIDQEWFRTYRDNKPHPYYNDESGNPIAEWPNEYGFVPVAIGYYKRLSSVAWGVNAFHHTIAKIDELNDGASSLNDYLRKAMNPIWYAPGVKRKEDLSVRTEDRDQLPILYGPSDSQMQSLVHNVDVTSAINAYNVQMQEIRDDLPELSLAELRDGGNLTAPGVRAGYSDAIDRLTESNGNMDDCLVRAIQMAVTIGGIRKYNNFQSFNETSYANGDLAFYIREREIVEDKLTLQEQIQAWQQSGVPQRKIWQILGATEEEIEEWEAEKSAQADLFADRFAAEDDMTEEAEEVDVES